MHQKCGRRSLISSRVLARSPSSLGMGVRARLYSVQGGKAQIMSCANMGSQLQTSAQMVTSALGPRSRLVTSQPSSAKARPTDPVPENSSSVASCFSMSGWKANQITAAKAAPQRRRPRSKRAEGGKGRIPRRAVGVWAPRQRAARGCA